MQLVLMGRQALCPLMLLAELGTVTRTMYDMLCVEHDHTYHLQVNSSSLGSSTSSPSLHAGLYVVSAKDSAGCVSNIVTQIIYQPSCT